MLPVGIDADGSNYREACAVLRSVFGMEAILVKGMDSHKFAFVICTNDELYCEECLWYINRLLVPDGYKKDVICITQAESMARAYNAAMESSDAKYKVYLHQDVFIYHRGFLEDILRIFRADEKLGMLGMIGGVGLPGNAVIWNVWNRGKVYACNGRKAMRLVYCCHTHDWKAEKRGFIKAEAIDGMLMVTQYDIPWREDLELGWDFYDISQSLEFRRKGYEVGIPFQETPWCMHDCGHSKLQSYDQARKHILKEYRDFFNEEYRPVNIERNEAVEIQEKIFTKMKDCFEIGAFDQVLKIREMLENTKIWSNNLQCAMNLADIYMLEKFEAKEKGGFFRNTCSFKDMKKKYDTIKFIIRHIENHTETEKVSGLYRAIKSGELSKAAVLSIAEHCAFSKHEIRLKISE